jgi:hypothetical protein
MFVFTNSVPLAVKFIGNPVENTTEKDQKVFEISEYQFGL